MSLKNDIQELYYNLTVENMEQKKIGTLTKNQDKSGTENFTKKEVSNAGNNKYGERESDKDKSTLLAAWR